MGRLVIEQSNSGDAPVLTLRGDLDIAGAKELHQELERIEATEPASLFVDLRGISFLDSSGLCELLAADARAKSAGRQLALVRGPDVVHRVFEIALLDKRLTFVDAPDTVAHAAS